MTRTMLSVVALSVLAGCAGPGQPQMSGASGTQGATAPGGRVFHADVREAIGRGSTQGFNPLTPLSDR